MKYFQCFFIFYRGELDEIGESDHYQDRFLAIVNIFVCDYSKAPRPMPWEFPRKVNPELLFGNTLEMDENYDNFGNYKFIFESS